MRRIIHVGRISTKRLRFLDVVPLSGRLDVAEHAVERPPVDVESARGGTLRC